MSDETSPRALGARGRPFDRRSPLAIGFLGATGALTAYFLLSLLADLRQVLVLVVVAAFLAVGLEPLTSRLQRRGLTRGRAVAAVTVGLLLVLVGFVLLLVPVLVDQVVALRDSVPMWLDALAGNEAIRTLDENYQVVERIQSFFLDGGLVRTAFGGALGFGLAFLAGLVNAFFLVVLTLYFLLGLPQIKAAAYQLAPASRRDRVSALGDEMLRTVGGYVSGAVVVAAVAGVTTLVFLVVVGLGEYAVALALVVALLDVIPLVGATIGGALVVGVGFATDIPTGIACLVFAVVYQQVENYLVYPRVMARTVDVPGPVILVAALTGATLLGVLGALLAVPVAASLLVLHREVLVPSQDRR
ncbi:AI-2E family transporter [Nocardioidaceae bacterium]|nr:AI-2E family transporter [Nocardioidaceae bacterium]